MEQDEGGFALILSRPWRCIRGERPRAGTGRLFSGGMRKRQATFPASVPTLVGKANGPTGPSTTGFAKSGRAHPGTNRQTPNEGASKPRGRRRSSLSPWWRHRRPVPQPGGSRTSCAMAVLKRGVACLQVVGAVCGAPTSCAGTAEVAVRKFWGPYLIGGRRAVSRGRTPRPPRT
jgi:hypothetical protein